jgi:hypothetical protein
MSHDALRLVAATLAANDALHKQRPRPSTLARSFEAQPHEWLNATARRRP